MPPETLDSLDQDSLKPLVLQLLSRIDTLVERNSELAEQIKTLLARIAELEARAGQPPKTPTNSSLPPSRGQKANVAAPPREKKGRKGRPASRGRGAKIPMRRVTSLSTDVPAAPHFLPPTSRRSLPTTTSICRPSSRSRRGSICTRASTWGQCPCCKTRLAAKPPADMMPGSPFGPGIVSLVTYLHACQLVSYARMREVLDGLFGVKLSEGAIANMLARAEQPFAERAGEIAQIVRNSDVIASDETSARVAGKTHWQWTFITSTAVYHTIAPTRAKAVPTEFLGQAKPKVWLSDRLAAQGKHAAAHQYCLAHLIRDAQYAIGADDTVFAPDFKRFLQQACAVGRRRPDLADATIKAYQRRLQRQLDRLLERKPTAAAGRHLRDAIIVDARDKLLVFLKRRDIEPTNNASERALRPSVIFRKSLPRRRPG